MNGNKSIRKVYRARRTRSANNLVREIRTSIEVSIRDKARGWSREGQWKHYEEMLKSWTRQLVADARKAEPMASCWIEDE